MMGKRSTVLIVDDSKENLTALRSILESSYTVYVATNGETALRLVARNMPDIVLLDVIMPGIDGFEVQRRMKADPKQANIPVIFITGDTDRFSEAKGLLLGAVDYIGKPYNPDIVSIKVRNQLENKLYRDNLELLVEERTAALRATQETIIFGMSLMAERRDATTGEHLKRMQHYVNILARVLHAKYPESLSAREMLNVIAFSPLHDVGKVAIADAILLKPLPLARDEFDEMKKHTIIGADILQQTQRLLKLNSVDLQTAIDIALSHHEKYDGTGYPHGLVGEAIPLAARIVALADVYDALTSRREYKEPIPHAVAADILMRGDGRTLPQHFDPLVLEAFGDCRHLFAQCSLDGPEPDMPE